MIDRLQILKDNFVIDEDVFSSSIRLHQGLMQERKYTTLNAYEVAMTHLVMAIQRVKAGECVSVMDDTILNEIKKDSLFSDVEEFTELVLTIMGVKIPEPEVQYLWLHFLNLFKEGEESL